MRAISFAFPVSDIYLRLDSQWLSFAGNQVISEGYEEPYQPPRYHQFQMN
jgi:hypothetical protein